MNDRLEENLLEFKIDFVIAYNRDRMEGIMDTQETFNKSKISQISKDSNTENSEGYKCRPK